MKQGVRGLKVAVHPGSWYPSFVYLNSSEDGVHSSTEGEKAGVHPTYNMYSQQLIGRTYEKKKKALNHGAGEISQRVKCLPRV